MTADARAIEIGQQAITLAQAGRLDEAVTHFHAALRLAPGFAPLHHNLGVALAQQGRPEEAAAALRQAIQLQPDYAEAHYSLGNVRLSQNQRAEAVAAYLDALRARPDYADTLNNLGLTLTELGRPGEAAVYLQQLVRLRPDDVEGHNNLGLAYAALGRWPEAEAAYREALRLNPRHAEAHANRACAYHHQGRADEAEASFQIALCLNPDAPSAHWNRSLLRLQSGKFKEGWQEYEWRWKRAKAPVYRGVARKFRQPGWDGSPLEGKTILLTMEQGLGDMIQFIRYAAPLHERGARVVVECPYFLARLFATCPGVDQVVAEGQPLPDFDTHAPLLSLPALVGTTLDTIPARAPYLFADGQLTEEWRQKLEAYPGFRVGIAWQGNPHHQWDRHRSIQLAAFEPLARVRGVRLFSLQHGHGTEQLGRLRDRDMIVALDTASDDFMETACLIAGLDLVITVDTAVAHLAGALGRPVWVPLAAISDWRWQFRREDSPWYPTIRLFRQAQLGDWRAVLRRMVRVLRRLAQRPQGARGYGRGSRRTIDDAPVPSVEPRSLGTCSGTPARPSNSRPPD
jgi:Flp pilus assembly protein TadD